MHVLGKDIQQDTHHIQFRVTHFLKDFVPYFLRCSTHNAWHSRGGLNVHMQVLHGLSAGQISGMVNPVSTSDPPNLGDWTSLLAVEGEVDLGITVVYVDHLLLEGKELNKVTQLLWLILPHWNKTKHEMSSSLQLVVLSFGRTLEPVQATEKERCPKETIWLSLGRFLMVLPLYFDCPGISVVKVINSVWLFVLGRDYNSMRHHLF